MKICLIFFVFFISMQRESIAQTQKNSVRPDSIQTEKIEKMPMDTTHIIVPAEPLIPLDTLHRQPHQRQAEPILPKKNEKAR
jgi:hypothetical protein